MMIFKKSQKLICAFCKLPHRVYLKKEVSVFDIALLFFMTGLFAYAIWGGPDLRSLLIFAGSIFVMQVALRMRYRESVKCPHCGFDPILYKRNHKQAAMKVRSFLEKRKENPEYMLKPQPNIKPIYLSKEEIKALDKAGELDLLALKPQQSSTEELPEQASEQNPEVNKPQLDEVIF